MKTCKPETFFVSPELQEAALLWRSLFGCAGSAFGVGWRYQESAVLGLRDAFNGKDSAKENLRELYLLMLLFCGTKGSLKPVAGSLQSPTQSS